MDSVKKYYNCVAIIGNAFSNQNNILTALDDIERQLALEDNADKSLPKKPETSIFDNSTNIENLVGLLLTRIDNSDINNERLLSVLCTACKCLLRKVKLDTHVKIGSVCVDTAEKAIIEKNWSVLEKCFKCLKLFDHRGWNSILFSECRRNKVLKVIKSSISLGKEELCDKDKQEFAALQILFLEVFTNVFTTHILAKSDIVKADEWFMILFPLLFDENYELRKVACRTFEFFKNRCADGSYRQSPIWPNLKEQIKITYSKTLVQFVRRNEVDWVDLWCLMLDILGPEFSMRKNTDLINTLLTVEENAFRSPNMNTRLCGFVGWKFLVNKFLDTSLEDATRRLKLLMQPLIANNSKTLDICTIKFDVWWQLIIGIEPCIEKHINVIYHFLNFCFGPVSDASAVNTLRTIGDLPASALLASRRPTISTTYPLVTSRRMKGLVVNRCDALAQILNLNLESGKTEYKLRSFQSTVISQLQTFLSLSKMLIHCVGECTILIVESSELTEQEKETYLKAVWRNLLLHIKRVENLFPTGAVDGHEPNEKQEKTEMLKNLFRILLKLSETSRENKNLAAVYLSPILELTVSVEIGVPDAVLNCRNYYVGTDIMMGTPLFTMLDIFLSPTCLNMLHQNEKEQQAHVMYIFLLQRILGLGIGPSDRTVLFTQAIMKRLDVAVNNTAAVDGNRVRRVWIMVAGLLTSGYVGLGRNINQGTEAQPDFECLMQVLMFPVVYSKIFMSEPDQEVIVKIWGQLFQAFQQNVFSNVFSVMGNEICNTLCGKVQQEIKRKKEMRSDELLHIMCLITNAIERIPFHTLNSIIYGSSFDTEKAGHLVVCFQLLQTVITEVQKFSEEEKIFVNILTQCAKCCCVFCENLRTKSINVLTFFIEQGQYFLSTRLVNSTSEASRNFSSTTLKMWNAFLKNFLNFYIQGCNKQGITKILNLLQPVFKMSFSHPNHDIHELTIKFGLGENVFMPMNRECNKCKTLQENTYRGDIFPRQVPSVDKSTENTKTGLQDIFNRPLTSHQREKLKQRRDDIPALYQDLTQDSQPSSSDFSQDVYQVKTPQEHGSYAASVVESDHSYQSSGEKPSLQFVLKKLVGDCSKSTDTKTTCNTSVEKDGENLPDQTKLKKKHVDTNHSASSPGSGLANSSEVRTGNSHRNEDKTPKTIIIIKRNGDNVLNSSLSNTSMVSSSRETHIPEEKKSKSIHFPSRCTILKGSRCLIDSTHSREMPIRMCISKLTTGTPEVKSIMTATLQKTPEKNDVQEIVMETNKLCEVSPKMLEKHGDSVPNGCTESKKEIIESPKPISQQMSCKETHSSNKERVPLKESGNDICVPTSSGNLVVSPSRVMVKRLEMKDVKSSTCKTLLFNNHDISKKREKAVMSCFGPTEVSDNRESSAALEGKQSSDSLHSVDYLHSPQVSVSESVREVSLSNSYTKERSPSQVCVPLSESPVKLKTQMLPQAETKGLEAKNSAITNEQLTKGKDSISSMHSSDLEKPISGTTDDECVERDTNSNTDNNSTILPNAVTDKKKKPTKVYPIRGKAKQEMFDNSHLKNLPSKSSDSTLTNIFPTSSASPQNQQFKLKPVSRTYERESSKSLEVARSKDLCKPAKNMLETGDLPQLKGREAVEVAKEKAFQESSKLNQEMSKLTKSVQKCDMKSSGSTSLVSDMKKTVEHKSDRDKSAKHMLTLKYCQESNDIEVLGVYQTGSKSPFRTTVPRKKLSTSKEAENETDYNKFQENATDLTSQSGATEEIEVITPKSSKPASMYQAKSSSSPDTPCTSKVDMTEYKNKKDRSKRSQSTTVDSSLAKDTNSPEVSRTGSKSPNTILRYFSPTKSQGVLNTKEAEDFSPKSQRILDSEEAEDTPLSSATTEQTDISKSVNEESVSEGCSKAIDTGSIKVLCEEKLESAITECGTENKLVQKISDSRTSYKNESSETINENSVVSENSSSEQDTSPITCDKGEYVRQLSLMPQTECAVTESKTHRVSTRSDWARRFGSKLGTETSKYTSESESENESDKDHESNVIDPFSREFDLCNEMMESIMDSEDVIESSQEPKEASLRSVPKDCFVKVHKLNLTPGKVFHSVQGPVLIAEKLSPISYRMANKCEDAKDGHDNYTNQQTGVTRSQDEENVVDNDTPVYAGQCGPLSARRVIAVKSLKTPRESSNSISTMKTENEEAFMINKNNLCPESAKGTDLLINSTNETHEKCTEFKRNDLTEEMGSKKKDVIKSVSGSWIIQGSSESDETVEVSNENRTLDKRRSQKRKFEFVTSCEADVKRRRKASACKEHDKPSTQFSEDSEETVEILNNWPVPMNEELASPSKWQSNVSVMPSDSPSKMKCAQTSQLQKLEDSSSHKRLSGRAAQLVGLALTKNKENKVTSAPSSSSEARPEEPEHDIVLTFNSEGQEEKSPWIRHAPHSRASPSRTNLKRRHLEFDDVPDRISVRKNVRFSDPEVTTELHFQKKEQSEFFPEPSGTFRIVRTKKGKIYVRKSGSSRERLRHKTRSGEAKPLWPQLKDCKAPVSDVLEQLVDSPDRIDEFLAALSIKNIVTVGDLCTLYEADIKDLPIKIPKVIIFKCVMQAYEQKLTSVTKCHGKETPSRSQHAGSTSTGDTEISRQNDLKTLLSSMNQADVASLLRETFSESAVKSIVQDLSSCSSKSVSTSTDISLQDSSTFTDESDFENFKYFLLEVFKKPELCNDKFKSVNQVLELLLHHSDTLCVLQELRSVVCASNFETTCKSENVLTEEGTECSELLKSRSARSALSQDSIHQFDQDLLNFTVRCLGVQKVVSEVFKNADKEVHSSVFFNDVVNLIKTLLSEVFKKTDKEVDSSVFINDVVNLIKTHICQKEESAVSMFQKLVTQENLSLSIQHFPANELIPCIVNQHGGKTCLDAILKESSLTFDTVMESITEQLSDGDDESLIKDMFVKLIHFFVKSNKKDVLLAIFYAINQLASLRE